MEKLFDLHRAQPEPIKDSTGAYDHRGRKWPVCQCYCLPCVLAWLCL